MGNISFNNYALFSPRITDSVSRRVTFLRSSIQQIFIIVNPVVSDSEALVMDVSILQLTFGLVVSEIFIFHCLRSSIILPQVSDISSGKDGLV